MFKSLRSLLLALASFSFLASGFAIPSGDSAYRGELNGIPIKAWLWWEGDNVVGFINRNDGKAMTMRLSGENHTTGKMTLKAMQGYGDTGIFRLNRQSEGGVTVWTGTATFKDGVAVPVTLKTN